MAIAAREIQVGTDGLMPRAPKAEADRQPP